MITATYEVAATDVHAAADAIALGQSIGNPDVRLERESSRLVEQHLAHVAEIDGQRVVIQFPDANFSAESGISHLLSVLIGGQLDIDRVRDCRLVDIDLGSQVQSWFRGPRFGIVGIRDLLGAHDRPLVGGIVKPKIGLSPQELADVCREMADGGVDFIKEDEILGDSPWCPLAERVTLVAKALDGYPTIYAPCITADGSAVVQKARLAKQLGAGAVHINIWSGLGCHLDVTSTVDIPVFFQKSGDRVWTSGASAIAASVLFRLVRLIGCDFTHVGMWGGYMSEDEVELRDRLDILSGDWLDAPATVPSFSCGAHPGLVSALTERFGVDIMVTAGGNLHGHPQGTVAGARAFRQAAERHQRVEPGVRPPELAAAIERWGYR